MWNSESDPDEAFRKKVIWGSGILVAIGLIGTGVYFRYGSQPSAAPKPAPPISAPPAPQAASPAEPSIENPIPVGPSAESKPLPALNDSDAQVRDSLSALFGADSVQRMVVPQSIVRHIVATVDNLPRKKVAVDLRPVKPTPGETRVTAQGDVTTLGAANFQRYAPFIQVVQQTDPRALAELYFRLYPLFQQSYEDLGYPGQYFNDRLVAVIDDLLKAPEPKGPIEVRQPKVFYEYADPNLESLSAGEKLMIRMGPSNEAIVKEKLRALRAVVASRPAPSTPPSTEPSAPPPAEPSAEQ